MCVCKTLWVSFGSYLKLIATKWELSDNTNTKSPWIPYNLSVISTQLEAVLSQLAMDSKNDSSQMLSLLRYRLTYVNQSLTNVLDSYGGLTSRRTKRGLINGVGQLSRMLFGSAKDDYVVELRHKFNSLIACAWAQSKVITHD